MAIPVKLSFKLSLCITSVVIFGLLVLLQCSGSTGPGNSSPKILKVTPSNTTVKFLESISILAEVNDADGDTLSFLWTASKGNFTFTSLDSAIWNAPGIAGSAQIVLKVNDPFGGIDIDSTTILVENQLPVISSLTASKSNILVGNIITLTVSATDPDGDLLSFQWSASDGEFVGSTTGEEVIWTASTTVSSVTITVTAVDESNDSVSQDIIINVFQELGSVWVADTFNDQVVKLASNGTELLRIDGLQGPQSLVVDNSDRSLWVADFGNDRIVKYSETGQQLNVLEGSELGFERPTDIAITASGNIWVTSMSDTNQVFEVSHDGQIRRRLNGFSNPESVDIFRSTGQIWVADTGNNRVIRFGSDVPDGYDLDSINVVPVRFDEQTVNLSRPEAIDVNQETGEIWVADTGNNRAIRISTDLSQLIIGGFQNPKGLAVNKSDGSVWIANTGESEVIKIFADVFSLPNKTPLASYDIDVDAGFHFPVTGFSQPLAIDINVNDNIVWFTEEFRVVKILDNGITFTAIGEFTNFDGPRALVINPGSDF